MCASISATQPVSSGSQVAIVTSVRPKVSGSAWRRSAYWIDITSATRPTSTLSGSIRTYGQLRALGEPLGERLGVEHLAVAETRQADAADPHERVLDAVAAGEAPRGALDVLEVHELVVAQPREHGAPGELAARDDVERKVDRRQRRRPRGRDRALERALALERAVARQGRGAAAGSLELALRRRDAGRGRDLAEFRLLASRFHARCWARA